MSREHIPGWHGAVLFVEFGQIEEPESSPCGPAIWNGALDGCSMASAPNGSDSLLVHGHPADV